MARDALTDNELMLKKTARRRLVGAITLVVVMLIILPFILKDRAVENTHHQVEITVVNRQANKEPIPELPEDENVLESAATDHHVAPVSQAEATPAPTAKAEVQVSPAETQAAPTAVNEENTVQATATNSTAGQVKPAEVKTPPQKAPEVQQQARQPAVSKPQEAKTQLATAPASAGTEKAAVTPPAPVTSPVTKSSNIPTATEAAIPPPESAKQTATLAAPTSQVQVEPPTKEATSTHTTAHHGAFFIQFGVFSEQKNLENLRAKLKQAGIATTSEKVDAAGLKLRLRSSRTYATRNEAMTALKKIQAAGFSGLVSK